MADRPTDLVPPAQVLVEPARLKPVPENVYVTIRVQDMTPMAADAARDVARYQFAVPARNRTYQVIAGAATVSFVVWLAASKLDGPWLGKVLIAAIGAIGGIFIMREWKKKD
jgi:hypothetical protein